MLDKLKSILEPGLIAELESTSRKIVLKDGETLIRSGQNVNAIPLVLRGSLRITRESEDGHELLLYYVSPNESCAMTFTCCMQQFPSGITATAEEETELLLIPIQLMDEWMQRYSSWKSFAMLTIRNRFSELLTAIDQIAFHKLDQRLLDYLQTKVSRTGRKDLHLSHEQIALELGTSREVISRLLKKLEHDKIVRLGRNLISML